MAVSDITQQITLILQAQNLSSAVLEALIASLDSAATKALSANTEMVGLSTSALSLASSAERAALSEDALNRALTNQAAATTAAAQAVRDFTPGTDELTAALAREGAAADVSAAALARYESAMASLQSRQVAFQGAVAEQFPATPAPQNASTSLYATDAERQAAAAQYLDTMNRAGALSAYTNQGAIQSGMLFNQAGLNLAASQQQDPLLAQQAARAQYNATLSQARALSAYTNQGAAQSALLFQQAGNAITRQQNIAAGIDPAYLNPDGSFNQDAWFADYNRTIDPLRYSVGAVTGANAASSQASVLQAGLDAGAPVIPPEERTPAAAGRGSSPFRGVAASLGYTVAFAVPYEAAKVFGQAEQYGLTSASTQATAGFSAQDMAVIQSGINGLISSGKVTVNAQALMVGAYYLKSAGMTDPTQIMQTLTTVAEGATAANSADVSTYATTLTTMMLAAKVSPSQMGAMSGSYQDLITEAVLLGKAQPSDLPTAIAVFAKQAAQSGVSIGQALGAFSFDTLTSQSPLASAYNLKDFLQEVTDPTKTARPYFTNISMPVGPGAIAGAGGLGPYISELLSRTGALGPGVQQEVFTAMFGQNALSFIEGAALNPGVLQTDIGKTSGAFASGGATTARDAALVTNSPAGQFKTAANEFDNALMNLATEALPSATGAVKALAGVAGDLTSLLHGPSGGGIMQSVAAAEMTAANLLVPGQPGFRDITKARAITAFDLGTITQAQENAILYSPDAVLYANSLHITPAQAQSMIDNGVNMQMYQIAYNSQHGQTFSGAGPLLSGEKRTSLPGAVLMSPPLTLLGASTATHPGMFGGMALGDTASGTPPGTTAPGGTAGLQLDAARATASAIPRGRTAAMLQLTQLTEALKIAEMTGGDVTSAENAVLAYQAANAVDLGYKSATDLTFAQDTIMKQVAGTTGTGTAATGPQLIRDRSIGFGDPRANFGEAITRLSGMGGPSETEKQLEKLVTADQQKLANDARQLANDATTIALLRQNNATELAINANLMTLIRKPSQRMTTPLRIG